MTLVYHPAARAEAKEAYLFLAREDESLALDFEKRLTTALTYILKNPTANRVRRFSVRRKNLTRFNRYYVAYMIWQDEVVVIAIAHSSRRPYYWFRRPKDYRDSRK